MRGPLTALFQAPTIEGLAAEIRAKDIQANGIRESGLPAEWSPTRADSGGRRQAAVLLRAWVGRRRGGLCRTWRGCSVRTNPFMGCKRTAWKAGKRRIQR